MFWMFDTDPNWRSVRARVHSLTATWQAVFVLGLGLFLGGLAILIFPQLLSILVATLLMTVGITVLAWAWRIRRIRNVYRDQVTGYGTDQWW